ncbi:hypothetical protein [Providencia heimbachae]|uniref:hypothetical protein n=1 Tax=Providencia heimbachae TaxID=333962 RepID=UPI0008391819|nr:hypothetical protein [Providencia heimbachae]
MKRILAVAAVVISVVVIGGAISVNFVPEGKVKDDVIANYCAEMTKSVMKSPESYKLSGYHIERYAPTPSEIKEQEKSSPTLANEKSLIWAKFVAQENYLAKNSLGVELRGVAKCDFMRAELGMAPHFYTLTGFSINGKPIDGIGLIVAETEAQKTIGRLSNDVTYSQKLKYIINQILN